MVWVGLRPDPCGDYTNVANRPAPHDHRAGCRLTSPVESQRDSVSMPRVASRELPWEKRGVSANPNGCGPMVERGIIVGVEDRTDANPG